MADPYTLPQLRILIVGDSHCRGMDNAIKTGRTQIQTFSVIFPRGTRAISGRYLSTLSHIRLFDPEIIFLHCGHNDLVYHASLNSFPINSQETRRLTLEFVQLLQQNHPLSKVIISALLPRTYKDNSSLQQDEVISFNKLVKRHGQRLRAEAANLNSTITVTLNNPIWKHISKSEEMSNLYLPDGLHLTNEGKLSITASWFADIYHAPPLASSDQCTRP
jgi:lysophospholipase L1-like esterase